MIAFTIYAQRRFRSVRFAENYNHGQLHPKLISGVSALPRSLCGRICVCAIRGWRSLLGSLRAGQATYGSDEEDTKTRY